MAGGARKRLTQRPDRGYTGRTFFHAEPTLEVLVRSLRHPVSRRVVAAAEQVPARTVDAVGVHSAFLVVPVFGVIAIVLIRRYPVRYDAEPEL